MKSEIAPYSNKVVIIIIIIIIISIQKGMNIAHTKVHIQIRL